MPSSINYLPTLTPADVLIGTAFLRRGEPKTIDFPRIGATDPTKEIASHWKKQWPGGDDMAVRDFQLTMVFLYDDGETVDSRIITLGECSPSMLPPIDGPPNIF
ncbi:hypothetical protein [Edaphobacter aggregans]|uniref:hypothetical protein n=1 Tax=Edaphobacter aggregans TaxID=570835 RepID=UPI00054E59EE|nr:hypothetical protein [Edaphobacter aggregans]